MAKRRRKNLKNAIGRKSECKVILTRIGLKNQMYQRALFEYHGICDLRVVVKRLANETVATKPQRRKLSGTTKLKSVRFHVPWLPTIASTKSSALENARDVPQPKPMASKRGRSPSFYHEQPENNDGCGKSHHGTLHCVAAKRQSLASITNEDLHQELLEKVSSPNRSLRSVDHRSNLAPTSRAVPQWKKIFQEFQQKKAEREMMYAEKPFLSDSL